MATQDSDSVLLFAVTSRLVDPVPERDRILGGAAAEAYGLEVGASLQ